MGIYQGDVTCYITVSCCKSIWTFTFLIKNVINTGIVLFKTLQSIQICQLTQNVRFEIHNIHTCSFYINNADTFLWVTFTFTHDEIKTKSGQTEKKTALFGITQPTLQISPNSIPSLHNAALMLPSVLTIKIPDLSYH